MDILDREQPAGTDANEALAVRAKDASMSVLEQLTGMGVADAALLTERLEAISQDPENVLAHDMGGVAQSFDRDLAAGSQDTEGKDAKRLSSLAHALDSVVNVRLVLSLGNLTDASTLLPVAQMRIEAARDFVSPETFESLQALLTQLPPAGPPEAQVSQT